MKMPWYSSYYQDTAPRNRFRQQSRTGNPASNVFLHTVHLSSSSYSTPSYRQQYYPSHPSPPPSYTRRHYQNDFSHFRPETSSLNSGASYRPRHSSPHSSPNSSTGSSSSPFKSRSDGSNWYHHRRTADSATERLLARADALTERLHRLLTKSADLHWRRTDNPVRPDIYSRMSQSKPQSAATGTSSAANMATDTNVAAPSVRVDDITVSKTEPRPTTRTHVITIKLSNSYSNRGNHRSQHLFQDPVKSPRTPEPQRPQRSQKPQEAQDPQKSQVPQDPQKPQEAQEPQKPQEAQTRYEPPKPQAYPRYEESQKFQETKEIYVGREETPERQETPEPPESPKEYRRQRPQESKQPSQHSSRSYRQSTTRKPPVVRIIPIHIEVESDDSGIVIDPERDIQVPDEDPRVPIVDSPISSRKNTSSIFVNGPVFVAEKPDLVVESDLEPELDIDLEEPIRPASGSTNSRRWALTLSLAEEKKAEGNAHYKVKDYRKALACYTRAIELCPESVAYYGNRAACRMMMGLYQDALEDARESTRLDSGFAKGYVRIAKCCLALGDTAAALNAVNKAEELDPNSDLTNEKRSLQILQQLAEEIIKSNAKGDYRKVIFCCDRSLEHAPAARRLKLTKAECLALLGRYAEAEEMANDVLRSDQTNADALLVRGLCFYYQDNIERAFLHFKQVLLMAPDHVKARDIFRRAKLLKTKKEEGNEAFKAGRYQEAHELYTATLIIDPNNKLTNAKVYFNRAVVLVKLGKLKEALGDCDRAIELDETYIKAYLRRAKISMDLEQFEDAVRDYEKVNKMEKNREYKRLLHEAKLALKKSQRKDYYKILGVDRNANDDEIKKAYKKRALVHHPDRHSSATEEEKKEQEKKFKELGEAYGILSDPKKKSRYDNGHDIDDNDGGGYSSEMDPNQIFQAFFGGPSMFRMGNMGGGMGGMGGGGMGGHCPGSFNFQFG